MKSLTKTDMVELTLKALDLDPDEIDAMLQRSKRLFNSSKIREWELISIALELLQAVNRGDVHIEYVCNSLENTFMKDSYN